MPFIRYETQDIVRLGEGLDRNGLYPHIQSVAGRKDDCILTPERGRLPTLNFYSLLQSYADILKFQLVQRNLSQVTMKIAVRPGVMNVPALLEKVRLQTALRLGPSIELRIEQTEEFERSPDGKTPAFRRLFTPEGDPSGQQADFTRP